MKITACDVCVSTSNIKTYEVRCVEGNEKEGQMFTFKEIDLCEHHAVELFSSYINTIPVSEGKKIQTRLLNMKIQWDENGNDNPF